VDPSGTSLWVAGQYSGGILLNFTLPIANDNAAPQYCYGEVAADCTGQQQAGSFNGAEGVAVFGGKVWVANNSNSNNGAEPGQQLLSFDYTPGHYNLTPDNIYPSTAQEANVKLECPGGLFAADGYLWVNDESYGETPPQCAAAGDVGSGVGSVLRFTQAQLASTSTDVSGIDRFPLGTSRPGFGGLFVEAQ
jgi:hypothetical protein